MNRYHGKFGAWYKHHEVRIRSLTWPTFVLPSPPTEAVLKILRNITANVKNGRASAHGIRADSAQKAADAGWITIDYHWAGSKQVATYRITRAGTLALHADNGLPLYVYGTERGGHPIDGWIDMVKDPRGFTAWLYDQDFGAATLAERRMFWIPVGGEADVFAEKVAAAVLHYVTPQKWENMKKLGVTGSSAQWRHTVERAVPEAADMTPTIYTEVPATLSPLADRVWSLVVAHDRAHRDDPAPTAVHLSQHLGTDPDPAWEDYFVRGWYDAQGKRPVRYHEPPPLSEAVARGDVYGDAQVAAYYHGRAAAEHRGTRVPFPDDYRQLVRQ